MMIVVSGNVRANVDCGGEEKRIQGRFASAVASRLRGSRRRSEREEIELGIAVGRVAEAEVVERHGGGRISFIVWRQNNLGLRRGRGGRGSRCGQIQVSRNLREAEAKRSGFRFYSLHSLHNHH